MPATAPRFWFDRGWRAWLLLPFSAIFMILSALRRFAYARGWRACHTVGVPVIVVGNIAVGGSGKTPAVVWLAAQLAEAGFTPGIISRGYGRRDDAVRCVDATASAAEVGDEPRLLASLTGCPVAVGRDRPAAAACLLRAHPAVDVILSDDGLQHLALARAVEDARPDFAWLDFDDAALATECEAGDLDAIDHAGVLREAADALLAEADDTARSHEEREIARAALGRLYAYARVVA